MIDHQRNRELREKHPDVASYQTRLINALMLEITTAFRNHNLIRRDILTDVTAIINNVPLVINRTLNDL